MVRRIAGSSCAAAFFALAAAAAGQAAPQAPAAPQTPGQQQDAPRSPSAAQPPASSDQVTLVGCVARANDGGAGTNHFTLRNATMGSGTASAALGDARSGSPSPGAVGTSGSGAAAGVATGAPTGAAAGAQTGVSGSAGTYALTGLAESDLSPYVGQRVEVIGRLDRSAAAGAPGGARDAAGAPANPGAAGSRGGSTTNPDAPLPGAGPAGRDRDAEADRETGPPAGARTPGSPVAGAPGSTTPAPGSTTRQGDADPRSGDAARSDSSSPSDDRPSSRADGSQDPRTKNPQPSAGQGPASSSVMQQVRVVSVRPLGGGCQ